jgi:hypothetical protein
MWKTKSGEIAVLQAELAAERRAHERLRLEYDTLYADFKRIVMTMGSTIGGRPLQQVDFERDPYAENDKLPDEWMTPAADEIPNVRDIEEALTPSAD